ncbi:unnamed protein product [Durusdinium trenchii]|uniref:Uncharacterized protein n=1 Tax=Durusdinium trenchii TaxID=1381693 RepID=A0ABP0NLF2_9DINO
MRDAAHMELRRTPALPIFAALPQLGSPPSVSESANPPQWPTDIELPGVSAASAGNGGAIPLPQHEPPRLEGEALAVSIPGCAEEGSLGAPEISPSTSQRLETNDTVRDPNEHRCSDAADASFGLSNLSLSLDHEAVMDSEASIGQKSTTPSMRPTSPPVQPMPSIVEEPKCGFKWKAIVPDQNITSTWSSTKVEADDSGNFYFFGQPLPPGRACRRILQVILTGLSSSLICGGFFTVSLALSGLWAVPGHRDASSFWSGFMNRMVWSLSPCFLGAFFPGLCNPETMDWESHGFFLLVSLVPFIICDVLFPYLVGTDSHFKIFFSTCFWPTTTCLFFVPSMIAGIRRCRGDPKWQDLTSQVFYICKEGMHFWRDLILLILCFLAAVLPVNYIALDFAVVVPSLSVSHHLSATTWEAADNGVDLAAAFVRPVISLCIKATCLDIFKFASSRISPMLHIYGMFPLALNIGLHNSMAAVLCQDWPSVGIWIACDFLVILWRTQRIGVRRIFFVVEYLPWMSEKEFLRRRGFEAIVMGWGLTAALSSLVMFSPVAWVLPPMLKKFLFPQGMTSVLYLCAVCGADILADVLSLTYLTHACKCDFGSILSHPFSKTLRCAYLSALTVVWAPCALGCFGWVFQHMCVAAFEASCASA